MQTIIPLLFASLGTGLSLLLVGVFFRRNRFYLGIVFLAISLILFEEILWISELIYNYKDFAEYAEFAIFLIPPSLYLYATSQMGKEFRSRFLLHYLPAILAFLNFIPFYFSGETLKACYIIEELIDEESVECEKLFDETLLYIVNETTLDFLNVLQYLTYLWLSYPLLKMIFKTKAKKVQSNFLSWSNLIISLIICAIALILIDVSLVDAHYNFFSIYYSTAVSVIVTYKLMEESLLLQNNFRANNYNSISKEDTVQVIESIKRYLQQEKVYQNPKMSIGHLASELKIPRNKIMYAFSQSNSNFKEELNQLRIEKAKELLIDNPNLTIEAIGNEVGYTSKATFYKYFKQFVGRTPTEFLRNT